MWSGSLDERNLFFMFINYRNPFKVRRGSVGSASACCKAGPSSILGSAPHGGSSLAERRSAMRIQEDRPRRMMKDVLCE